MQGRRRRGARAGPFHDGRPTTRENYGRPGMSTECLISWESALPAFAHLQSLARGLSRHFLCRDWALDGVGDGGIDALMILLHAGLSWFTLRTRHA